MALPLLALGILSRLAPVARTVYQGIRANKAVRATGKAISNPYVNTGLTGLGIYDAAERIPEMKDKFKQGDIRGGISDASILAAESFFLPAGVREAGKAVKGLGSLKGKQILDNTADKIAKVTREGTGTKTKAAGVTTGILQEEIPNIIDADSEPNPDLRDGNVKKEDTGFKFPSINLISSAEASDDAMIKAAIDADKDVNTPKLDQQVKPNVVNQDLIPDVDMSDFKKGTAGDAGPTGTDAESMNMDLAKLTDDKDDSPVIFML